MAAGRPSLATRRPPPAARRSPAAPQLARRQSPAARRPSACSPLARPLPAAARRSLVRSPAACRSPPAVRSPLASRLSPAARPPPAARRPYATRPRGKHLCKDVHQPVLDDVPDHVYRQMPGGNPALKDHEWHSLARWIRRKQEEGDFGAITATTPDENVPPRTNLLGTLANFRPTLDETPTVHMKFCYAAIIKAHYDDGLINMRLGKDRSTALLRAAACGNIEAASLLLEFGAGIPLWLITLWAHFLGWGYGGEGVVSERGARRNGSGHDPLASRASAGCLLCQGVFVPITVGSFLCQGVAPSMVGGRNGIMARLVPPTVIGNHIAFPRPPINDFSYFFTPFGLPCVSAQARVSQ
jgi:hypothetical protein